MPELDRCLLLQLHSLQIFRMTSGVRFVAAIVVRPPVWNFIICPECDLLWNSILILQQILLEQLYIFMMNLYILAARALGDSFQ